MSEIGFRIEKIDIQQTNNGTRINTYNRKIGYHNQNILIPGKYPYLEHLILWDKYHAESYKKACFKDDLNPYLAGSSLAEIYQVSENGTKLIAYQDTEQYKLMKYFMNNHERMLYELGFDF